MGNKLEKWTGMDADDLLSYRTTKVVVVRDRYLGLLSYGFMLLIFVYIIVFNVLINKGYLKYDTPLGTIRTTLSLPNTFEEAKSLPYCQANNTSPSNHQCLYLNRFDVYSSDEASAFIATRITQYEYTNAKEECLIPSHPDCVFPEPDSPQFQESGASQQTFFVACPERYNLGIEHTVTAESIKLKSASRFLEGRLVGEGGEELEKFRVDDVAVDVLSLSQLLRAAGLHTLDSRSNVSDHSLRHEGLILIIFIEYSMDQRDSTKILYNYRVRRITDANFKMEENLLVDPKQRKLVVRNKHGIKLYFVQTGQLGEFDLPTLLSCLVNGLVLLTAANTITEILMIYFMPERKLYCQAKYSYTSDFSDIRDNLKEQQTQSK